MSKWIKAAIIGLAVSNNAYAGLNDGVRGKKWGEVLETAPSESCNVSTEANNADDWVCKEKIGDVDVDVGYGLLQDKRMYSVIILAQGFASCQKISNTLTEAWGRGGRDQYDSSPLPKTSWYAMGTLGSFEYNRYSEKCTVLSMSVSLYREKEKADKKKAAEAAKSL
jgi:hypothetical protein